MDGQAISCDPQFQQTLLVIRTMNDLDKAFEDACRQFEGRRLSDLDEIGRAHV